MSAFAVYPEASAVFRYTLTRSPTYLGAHRLQVLSRRSRADRATTDGGSTRASPLLSKVVYSERGTSAASKAACMSCRRRSVGDSAARAARASALGSAVLPGPGNKHTTRRRRIVRMASQQPSCAYTIVRTLFFCRQTAAGVLSHRRDDSSGGWQVGHSCAGYGPRGRERLAVTFGAYRFAGRDQHGYLLLC